MHLLSLVTNTIVCRPRVYKWYVLFTMENINEAIAKTLANLRHLANISQEELAARAGIHRTYVSQIERGLKSPTLQVLIQIANALDTTASSILQDIERALDEL